MSLITFLMHGALSTFVQESAVHQSQSNNNNNSFERGNLFLTYILQIFKQTQIIVKDQSDFRNLSMLVQFIQSKAPYVKIHLVLWQLSARRVVDFRQCCNFQQQSPQMGVSLVGSTAGVCDSLSNIVPTGNYSPLFDSVSLQGSMNKEDYSDLCSYLINKTATISFLSCSVDFKKIAF